MFDYYKPYNWDTFFYSRIHVFKIWILKYSCMDIQEKLQFFRNCFVIYNVLFFSLVFNFHSLFSSKRFVFIKTNAPHNIISNTITNIKIIILQSKFSNLVRFSSLSFSLKWTILYVHILQKYNLKKNNRFINSYIYIVFQ